MSSETMFSKKLNEESILFLDTFISFVPNVSEFLSSSQLTFSSLVWAFTIVLAGYKARHNISWLWLGIIAVFLHMSTDLIDGALSKYTKDGMEKWNFFMDHLFDYIFALALFACFAFLTYKTNDRLFIISFIVFALITINMVASFILVFENGLDLGINIFDVKLNIFHMHFVICAVFLAILYTNGNIIYSKSNMTAFILTAFILFLAIITGVNIYEKQKKLVKPIV